MSRNPPILKVYTNERVFFKGRRMVKNGQLSCFYKRFTNPYLQQFNNIYLYVFELSNGQYYAQTTNGTYVFPLEKVSHEKEEKQSTNYLNYLRSLK